MKLKKTGGFTLIEMIVVLSIMAILMSMVMPAIQENYRQFEMDAAIHKLHKDIRWAQSIADREQKRVTVGFYVFKQPYQYVIRISGDSTVLRKVELPNHLTKTSTKTILINPDRTFRENGHVLLQRGEVSRYVYYYQTGRSRVSAGG